MIIEFPESIIFLNHSLPSECQKKVLQKMLGGGVCGFGYFSLANSMLVVLLEVLIPVGG